MKLTTKGRFAVTAMLDLALHGHDGPVTLAGISERQKISLYYLEQLFGGAASDIHTTPRDFYFRYRSPQHWVDVFRSWYGPVLKAFEALPTEGQQRLEQDLLSLVHRFNRSGDSTMVVPAEYLEVVIVRK